ncbi:5518_t:CDS:2 [Gigaspora margarita]|uniref:5518_t:CDS:1 n=1 Tax=Gigaspora margarita TaxID=4874 RepID=A0ABN7UF37_GIGMA|nr:5518_t:CDS:2 [Gigaspora margarita]
MNVLNDRNEIYVDYALHNKVGIYSNKPFLRVSFKPSEKITWQIEGEALAIKAGVYYFLKNRVDDKDQHLIIYTDTQWLARKNGLNLQLKFIPGKDNPADQLTRSPVQKNNLIMKDQEFEKVLQELEDPKNIGYQEDNNLSDEAMARKIHLTLSETEDILFCRISKFSLDSLMNTVSELFSHARIKVLIEKMIKKITITDHPWRKPGREKITKELVLNILIEELNGRKRMKPNKTIKNRDVYVRE